jgi:tungstate transport system ATP-binding protein
VTAVAPIVSLADVRVRYGRAEALAIDRFEALPGEVVAVMGPNGSGKSTLLRLIGLLEPPASGEIRFRGRPVHASRALDERRQMAMVFQQPLLHDGTVADNVALGLVFRGVSREERRARVDHWLARLGIAPLAARRACTLSGGEAQRVALARALVLDPALLLLDEPFTALDEPSRAALLADIGAILRADRVTTILVTHDRGEAQMLADRVGVMLAGRIRQIGETARVFGAPESEEIARFVGVETIVTGRVLARDAGVTVVEVAGRKLEVAALAAPGDRVRLCVRPEDVTLTHPSERTMLSSARNHLAGTIAAMTATSAHVRVVVDCGFPLVAAVTRRSVEDLGLAPGVPVLAVFKASAAHLLAADRDRPA